MNKVRPFFTYILIALSSILFSCSPKFMVVKTPAELPAARKFDSPPRVALVLGGGAFRGIAHVGVLKVLEEEHIPIDIIIGTSAGSLVGAIYATNPHADSLYPLIANAKRSEIFDISLFNHRTGIIKGKKLQEFVTEHTGITSIEETRIPFIAVATDLMAETTVPFSSGPIAPAVNASCAIPTVFRPVSMYGTIYVDGGVMDIVPTDVAASLGAQVIIAVDVLADDDSVITISNRYDIAMRCIGSASRELKDQQLKLADILIAPDLFGMPLMGDKKNKEIYDAGVKAARAAIPKLREILIKKNIIQ
jgi:NTE family protein